MSETQLVDLFLYLFLALGILVYLYAMRLGTRPGEEDSFNRKFRNAFRLRWAGLPVILYSAMALILRSFFPILETFQGSMFTILGFPALLLFFPLIPVCLKFGWSATRDPEFFRR